MPPQRLRLIAMLPHMPIGTLAQVLECFGIRVHSTVNGGFTVSEISSSIWKHPMKKTPGEGPTSVRAVFSCSDDGEHWSRVSYFLPSTRTSAGRIRRSALSSWALIAALRTSSGRWILGRLKASLIRAAGSARRGCWPLWS